MLILITSPPADILVRRFGERASQHDVGRTCAYQRRRLLWLDSEQGYISPLKHRWQQVPLFHRLRLGATCTSPSRYLLDLVPSLCWISYACRGTDIGTERIRYTDERRVTEAWPATILVTESVLTPAAYGNECPHVFAGHGAHVDFVALNNQHMGWLCVCLRVCMCTYMWHSFNIHDFLLPFQSAIFRPLSAPHVE